MRAACRRFLTAWLRTRCRRRGDLSLAEPAVVVAPHYDDEVLACGGTILRKRMQGAPVSVIFLTDGSKSHRHLMAPSELSAIRKAEARAAIKALGLDETQVFFLEEEETMLDRREAETVALLTPILARLMPRQVFLPYGRDGHPDHEAASRITRRAVREAQVQCVTYEYPVWAWHHWPWSPVRLPSRSDLPRIVSDTVAANLRLLARINTAIDVTSVRHLKQQSLDEYRSQMTRLVPDPRWLTLGDVAGGQFLSNLLGPHEFFAASEVPPPLDRMVHPA